YEYITHGTEANVKLERGDYTIKLEKEGYRTSTKTVKVYENRTIVFSALTPEKTGVDETADEEKLSTFSLTYEGLEMSEDGIFRLSMTEGDDPVELSISSSSGFSPDTVRWICNGDAAIKSSPTGSNVLVEAKGEGSATITIEVKIGAASKEYTCVVTIEKGKEEPQNQLTLSETFLSLNIGEEAELTISISDESYEYSVEGWVSDNTDVAIVDDSGKVTAVGAGNATITATVTVGEDTTSLTCEVTVINEEEEKKEEGKNDDTVSGNSI
ncbi:MAG: Ig-like domain-containing protein, partial [Lachnospiraceae bacterium]|nr:Ig-like domain-containing protein [Lachnospiraceae bacterium]